MQTHKQLTSLTFDGLGQDGGRVWLLLAEWLALQHAHALGLGHKADVLQPLDDRVATSKTHPAKTKHHFGINNFKETGSWGYQQIRSDPRDASHLIKNAKYTLSPVYITHIHVHIHNNYTCTCVCRYMYMYVNVGCINVVTVHANCMDTVYWYMYMYMYCKSTHSRTCTYMYMYNVGYQCCHDSWGFNFSVCNYVISRAYFILLTIIRM